MKPIMPKLGYYKNKTTGEIIMVDYVRCGQNEIYGECNGMRVISDYNTTDDFEYLGLSPSIKL